MNYVTLTQITKRWTPPDGFSDSDIEEYAVLAEEMIEKFTNDKFRIVSDTLEVDGSGSSMLNISKYTSLQILSITQIKYISDTYDEVIDSSYYEVYKRFIKLDESLEIRGYPYLSTGNWVKGSKNYEVTGTFGWSSTPALITRAAILLARKLIDNDDPESAGGALSPLMKSEKIGDYSYTKDDGGDFGKNLQSFTGDIEIDSILSSYINKIPYVGAV